MISLLETVCLAIVVVLVISIIFLARTIKALKKETAAKISGLYEKIRAIDLVLSGKKEKPRKIRKRYIVFAVIGPSKIDKKNIETKIREYWTRLWGENSLVKADPQLVYFDPKIMRGVLRVSHMFKDEAIAVLGMIRKLGGQHCLLIPLKTTGTIKKARTIMYSLRKELQK